MLLWIFFQLIWLKRPRNIFIAKNTFLRLKETSCKVSITFFLVFFISLIEVVDMRIGFSPSVITFDYNII